MGTPNRRRIDNNRFAAAAMRPDLLPLRIVAIIGGEPLPTIYVRIRRGQFPLFVRAKDPRHGQTVLCMRVADFAQRYGFTPTQEQIDEAVALNTSARVRFTRGQAHELVRSALAQYREQVRRWMEATKRPRPDDLPPFENILNFGVE